MYKSVLLLVFVIGCQECLGKIAPSYIKPCPELTPECLKDTIQQVIPEFSRGSPELGINSTDPLLEDYVALDLVGIKIRLENVVGTGLKGCIVESARYKNESNVAKLNLNCNLLIKGKYKANGRILIVSINGDGDAKVKVSNVLLNVTLKFHDVVRDGVVYYDVKDYKVKHQFAGRITYALTNLFKGNPEISEAVLKFINENWKQLADEFGKPVVDTAVEIIFRTVKKFFSVVPKNELFVM